MHLGRSVLRALLGLAGQSLLSFGLRLVAPHRLGLRYSQPPAPDPTQDHPARPMYRARDGPL
jgi:hypothetical protein